MANKVTLGDVELLGVLAVGGGALFLIYYLLDKLPSEKDLSEWWARKKQEIKDEHPVAAAVADTAVEETEALAHVGQDYGPFGGGFGESVPQGDPRRPLREDGGVGLVGEGMLPWNGFGYGLPEGSNSP